MARRKFVGLTYGFGIVLVALLLLADAFFSEIGGLRLTQSGVLSSPSFESLNGREMVTEPRCIGRFLIDVPRGTEIVADYTVLGSKTSTFTETTPEMFQQRVANKQRMLQDSLHGLGGSMFVDRDDISHDHITLVSWASVASKRVYRYHEYRYLPKQKALYHFIGEGTASETHREKARELQRKYADLIRYREALAVPEEFGFCIDQGLIINTAPNKEEMTVDFFFPDYPDIRLSLMSLVTAYDMDVHLPGDAAAMRLPGAIVLRNTVRKWGDGQAAELLMKYPVDGEWLYEFSWKVASKGNALAHPFISVSLQTAGYLDTVGTGTERSGEGGALDDYERLRLWDQVVGSLRLRPGAVQPNPQN